MRKNLVVLLFRYQEVYKDTAKWLALLVRDKQSVIALTVESPLQALNDNDLDHALHGKRILLIVEPQ